MSTRETKDGWTEPDADADAEPEVADDLGPAEADAAADEELLEEASALAEAEPAVAEPGPGPTGEAAEYRDALLRVKADFENYKKRVAKDHAATVERAAEALVVALLPVLDACEAAIAHDAAGVEPIYKSLVDILEKSGLTRVPGEGSVFDPNLHEAVLHEPGDGDEIVVSESLRTGYEYNGRVVRPAMVKVRG